jgi:hypothetical protein
MEAESRGLSAPGIPFSPFLPNARPRFVSVSVFGNPGAGRLHGQTFDDQREKIRFHRASIGKRYYHEQVLLLMLSEQEQLRKILVIVE